MMTAKLETWLNKKLVSGTYSGRLKYLSYDHGAATRPCCFIILWNPGAKPSRVMTIKYLDQPNQKVTLKIVWIILGNYLNILAVNLQPLACQSYRRYVSCINRSSFLRWAKRCKEAVTTGMFHNVLSAGEESIVPGILKEKKKKKKRQHFQKWIIFHNQ